MDKYKREGVLIHFHELREQELIQYTRNEKIKNFSDAFDVLNWKVKAKEIAIISFSSKTLDYIALATKKQKVVTEKNKIEFSHIIDLRSLQIESIKELKGIDFKSFFIDERKINKAKLSSEVLELLLSGIKENREYLIKDIDRLITLQKFSNYTLIGTTAEQLLQEREAFASALDIFDSSTKLRKEVLSSWIPNSEKIITTSEEDKEATIKLSKNESMSFLDGIERTVQEETTLQHDLWNFDGFMLEKHEGGHSIFTLGDRKLNILYTNRTALEKAIGIDLIYYNEKYDSFILVQYKLLKRETENDIFLYRPDEQMKNELSRMNDFMLNYKNDESIKSNKGYRLNDDGFIFKFVENKGIKIASSELMKGLYITREYMNFIESPNGTKGVRGGTIISTKHTPRYLTNSEFTMLMNGGFLGTRGVQSRVLKDLIESYFETGKAVFLAIETDSKQRKLDEY